MNQTSYIVRLALYVAISMVATASAGLMAVDFTDRKQLAAFTLGVVSSGLVTARSFIDKSPAQVRRPSEDFVPLVKP